METFNLESEKKTGLFSRLELTGLDKTETENFRSLIEKIKFSNININSELGAIHVDMIASLLTKQENGEVFLQNILKAINHDWHEVEEFLISSTKELDVENIDLDVGANRRVDKIECVFADEAVYDFTLSTDLIDHKDINNSNSYVEKEVFESPLAENNPVLQSYFGYLERKLSGRNYRLIAKEYLPGKNISQYFNEFDRDVDVMFAFDDVTCELAYSMGSLYKRMQGKLLEDLKLENIIYNYKNPDSNQLACRVCDHSGYYEENAEYRSVSQIIAQLSSLLTLYSLKADQLEKDQKISQEDYKPEDLIINYLESFLSELDDQNLEQLLLKKVKEIRGVEADERMFDLPDDLLEFIIYYLENNI